MTQVKKRLLIIGVLVLAGGVIFETLATNLLAQVFSLHGGSGGGIGIWLMDFTVSVVRFGLAPLGASLVALGIAAHMLRDQTPSLLNNRGEDE